MQFRTRLLFLGAVCLVAWLIFRSIDGQTEKVVILDCSETVVLSEFVDDRMREALLRHLSASAGWTVGIAGVKGVLEATMQIHGPCPSGKRA